MTASRDPSRKKTKEAQQDEVRDTSTPEHTRVYPAARGPETAVLGALSGAVARVQ